jgi:hypothetical protein
VVARIRLCVPVNGAGDGAIDAQLLAAFRKYIEDPVLMLA